VKSRRGRRTSAAVWAHRGVKEFRVLCPCVFPLWSCCAGRQREGGAGSIRRGGEEDMVVLGGYDSRGTPLTLLESGLGSSPQTSIDVMRGEGCVKEALLFAL
jgi:hypothetical protein